jgi:hypothetical protein
LKLNLTGGPKTGKKAELTHVATFMHVYWEIFELQRCAHKFAKAKDANHNFKYKIKLAGKD